MSAVLLENWSAAVVLIAMMIVPLADVVIRAFLHHGITGEALIVQHLGLILGMAGGAIAAREGRLLSLSTLGDHARAGSWTGAARLLGVSMSVAISGSLAFASYQFVATEYLFGKTIQRYDDHVRIQNLEEAVFDQPLALRIVELHGGQLGLVDSRPGRTEFRLILPT